jgi:hypothetical protein
MIPMIVDGIEVAVFWQDLTTHRRLTVFRDGIEIGHKDLPIRVDTGNGTAEYVVKGILRGQNVKAELN